MTAVTRVAFSRARRRPTSRRSGPGAAALPYSGTGNVAGGIARGEWLDAVDRADPPLRTDY